MVLKCFDLKYLEEENMMKEIRRNLLSTFIQYARYPSRCTFTVMSSFLSRKSQRSEYHYYPYFKDGKLRFKKVKCLTHGHEAINNGWK